MVMVLDMTAGNFTDESSFEMSDEPAHTVHPTPELALQQIDVTVSAQHQALPVELADIDPGVFVTLQESR